MKPDKIKSIIESLLFVAGEPVSVKRICDLVSDASQPEVVDALDRLVKKWDSKAHGLRVVEVAGGYQFQTPPENAPWVGSLLQSRPVRLSRPSLETMSIIAYKQPVTRAEIEQVRGVDSGGVLKTLLEYGFIRIMGRKDVPGKPLIYATDKRFMEFFRLKSLSELPTLQELSDIQEERMEQADTQEDLPFEDTPEDDSNAQAESQEDSPLEDTPEDDSNAQAESQEDSPLEDTPEDDSN